MPVYFSLNENHKTNSPKPTRANSHSIMTEQNYIWRDRTMAEQNYINATDYISTITTFYCVYKSNIIISLVLQVITVNSSLIINRAVAEMSTILIYKFFILHQQANKNVLIVSYFILKIKKSNCTIIK